MKKLIALTLAASVWAALPISPGGPKGGKGLSDWKPIQVEARFTGSPKQKGNSLELLLTAAPGWEITSNAPEDESAFPSRFKVTSPGIAFGAPRWPEPRRVPMPELGFDRMLFGGQFQVSIPVRAMGKYDTTATRGFFFFQSCQGMICHAPDSVAIELR